MACLSRPNSDADRTPDKGTFQINLTICSSELNFNPDCFISPGPDTDWRPRPPPKRSTTMPHDPCPLSAPRQRPLGPRQHEPLKPHSGPPRLRPSGPRALDAACGLHSATYASLPTPRDLRPSNLLAKHGLPLEALFETPKQVSLFAVEIRQG